MCCPGSLPRPLLLEGSGWGQPAGPGRLSQPRPQSLLVFVPHQQPTPLPSHPTRSPAGSARRLPTVPATPGVHSSHSGGKHPQRVDGCPWSGARTCAHGRGVAPQRCPRLSPPQPRTHPSGTGPGSRAEPGASPALSVAVPAPVPPRARLSRPRWALRAGGSAGAAGAHGGRGASAPAAGQRGGALSAAPAPAAGPAALGAALGL